MSKKTSLPHFFYTIPLPKKIQAIAFWPVVFVQKSQIRSSLIQHERIHLRQQWEMGLILFYVWYILEWIFRSLQCRSCYKGYRAISFEKEAYTHEKTPHYLSRRRFWAFLAFL